MAFTTESMDAAPAPKSNLVQDQFDLPTREFQGYDPKGTTSVTGEPLVRPDPANVKQPDTSETKGAVEPAQPEESVTVSRQISAVARKEQAQRQREQALKQREQALEAKLADAEKYAQLQKKLAAKDYSAADDLGMTYEEYTAHLLKKQETESPEEKRIRTLEERLAAAERDREERTLNEYQENQKLWKQEISKIVSESDAYPEIKYWKAEGAILQHINDSFELDGVELDAETAAKEIEEQLVKRTERFVDSPTIKQRFESAPRVLGAPKSSPKTITQNMTVTSQKPANKPFHLLSESEQIAEAIRRVNAAKQMR